MYSEVFKLLKKYNCKYYRDNNYNNTTLMNYYFYENDKKLYRFYINAAVIPIKEIEIRVDIYDKQSKHHEGFLDIIYIQYLKNLKKFLIKITRKEKLLSLI